MNKLLTSEKIYISKSKIAGAGKGVFAKCDIKKGELIEKCPIIELSEDDTSRLNETILITYLFYHGAKKEEAAIALGFGSIYNHSGNPNAVFEIKPKKNVIEFTATKNIKKDTEITFNYRGSSKSKYPLWFE